MKTKTVKKRKQNVLPQHIVSATLTKDISDITNLNGCQFKKGSYVLVETTRGIVLCDNVQFKIENDEYEIVQVH